MVASKMARAAPTKGSSPQNLKALVGAFEQASTSSGIRNQRKGVDEARLRFLARRLHSLGERSVYEFLREIIAGANALYRLEVFARLDHALLAAIGADVIPSALHVFDGGRT